MDAIGRIARALEDVARRLDAADMEPDPTRTDWTERADRLDAIRALVQSDIVGPLDEALKFLEDRPSEQAAARERTAAMEAEVAAVFHAAGRTQDAQTLWRQALGIGPTTGPVHDEIEAALREPEPYVALVHAGWLGAQRRHDEANSLILAALGKTRNAVLRRALQSRFSTAAPMIGSPPVLFQLNGCGVALFGSRDERSDGSYVATLCLTLLYIPVLPLRAYRVTKEGTRSYRFHALERLSAFFRVARVALVVAALVGGGAYGAMQWWKSPDHRASVALAHAAATERAHRSTEALAEYESVLRTYDGPDVTAAALAPAADGVVRLLAAGVHRPVTRDDADALGRLVLRYTRLPASARVPTAAAALASHLLRWSEDIGTATIEDAQAALTVAERASAFAPPTQAAVVTARLHAIHARLGALLAGDWPAEALPHLIAGGANEVDVRGSITVVAVLVGHPPLALSVDDQIVRWSLQARTLHVPELDALATQVDEALAHARATAADVDRNAALASGEQAALERALARDATDQEVIAALAEHHRAVGDVPRALALMAPLGGAGRMVLPAQVAYATCLMNADRSAEAEAILAHVVATRMPLFRAAQQTYAAAARDLEQRLLNQAEQGLAPADINRRLGETRQDRQAQRAVFDEWLRAMQQEDPGMATARQDLLAFGGVVQPTLLLATLTLQRANAASGAERTRLLSVAERLFLSIREEAENDPWFHIGLGQVYHRLGRAEEGDREMAAVLAHADPDMKLTVSTVYRELGIDTRAREIAQDVYDHAPEPARGIAAFRLSLLADSRDAREMWLRRAPQSDVAVRLNLRNVEAQRLIEQHRIAEADHVLAEVATGWITDGDHDAAASNNAALAEQERFYCTGDPARLVAAVQHLEDARRLLPDDALVLTNLAGALTYAGTVRALARFVNTHALRPDMATAGTILGALLGGTRRDEVLAAMRSEALLRRGRDVSRQLQTLSPESAGAYDTELGYDDQMGDTAALEALRTRVATVAHIAWEARAAERDRYVAGDDGEVLRSMAARLVAAEATVSEARASHDAATLAAAYFVRAQRRLAQAVARTVPATADAAVLDFRAVQETSSSVGVSYNLAMALMTAATLHLTETMPSMAAIYRREGRRRDLDLMLLHATQPSEEGDAVSAALRARPDAMEALTLLRADGGPRSAASATRVLARALRDTEPASGSSADAVDGDARQRVVLDIERSLDPTDVNVQERLALLAGRAP